MNADAVTELAGLILTLPGLPAEDRALRARRLVNQAKTVLAEVGDQATAELAAETGYKEAAHRLGVSESMINKAVSRQRSRTPKES